MLSSPTQLPLTAVAEASSPTSALPVAVTTRVAAVLPDESRALCQSALTALVHVLEAQLASQPAYAATFAVAP
jgi:hypothetical protein